MGNRPTTFALGKVYKDAEGKAALQRNTADLPMLVRLRVLLTRILIAPCWQCSYITVDEHQPVHAVYHAEPQRWCSACRQRQPYRVLVDPTGDQCCCGYRRQHLLAHNGAGHDAAREIRQVPMPGLAM